MLPFRVVATHQSRSSQPALISFPPCSHASLFFAEDYVPSSATGAPQPFVYQSLPHSFHRDGGCTPSLLSSKLGSSDLRTVQRVSELFPVFPNSCALFCTFLHSRKTQPFYFQPLPHSLRKTTRVGGEGSMGWSPKNEMTWTENAPKPLSSLTTVNCPLSTTRHVTAQETSFVLPVSIEKIQGGRPQYAIGPTSFSTSAISTMTMASHGQPSRKQPSGPLLRHFLHPMHWMGSIWMRPNGGLSSSGTQNMQSSTGQYSTQAGDPAHPVQHSVMTASSFGFFLRAVEIPLERGSCFSSSGTIPGALTTCGSAGIEWDFASKVKLYNRDSRRPSAPRYHSRRHPALVRGPLQR